MPRTEKTNVVWNLFSRETGLGKHRNSQHRKHLQYYAELTAATSSQTEHCEISGQARSTLVMTFSRDGKKIASTHGDHTIRVTDLRNGKCTHVLQGHPRTPWCVVFHPACSDILASGCLAGEVRIWDLKGGGSEIWRSPEGLSVASLAFHPADNVLVFAVGNRLRFWAWKQSDPYHECRTSRDFEKIRWVKFDPLGHCLYTGIANGSNVVTVDDNFLGVEHGLTGDQYAHLRPPAPTSDYVLRNGELSHLLTRNASVDEPASFDLSVFGERDETNSDWTPRVRRFVRSTAAVASARQYAAEVTGNVQRGFGGGRHNVNDASDRAAASSAHSRTFNSNWENRRSLDPEPSSSVWESPYVSDLYRRRRRLLRIANPAWHSRDTTNEWQDPPVPSWQTRSSLGTSYFESRERNDLDSMHPTLSDTNSPTLNNLLPTGLLDVTTDDVLLPDQYQIPVTVGDRQDQVQMGSRPTGLMDNEPRILQSAPAEDINADNEIEEITSTGAEAGSTASLAGDTESVDADVDARSVDVEVGSVGAEVGSTGAGHGAEVGFGEIPTIVIHPDTVDCGPAATDSAVGAARRVGRFCPRLPFPERDRDMDYAERVTARRWRRFSRSDLRNDLHSYASSSVDQPSSSDWREMDWTSDVFPRRLPQFSDTLQRGRNWPSYHSDTSAASVDHFSDIPGYQSYHMEARLRDLRDYRSSTQGVGASSNSSMSVPHECGADCEICNGVPHRASRRSDRRLPWRLTEITFDRLQAAREHSSLWASPSVDALGPAASATDDAMLGVDPRSDSLSALHRDIQGARRSVGYLHRVRLASTDASLPTVSEFDRRVRLLDERVSRMQQRLNAAQHLHAERDATQRLQSQTSGISESRSSSQRERLRERLRFHLEELRSRYGETMSSHDEYLGGNASLINNTEEDFALGPPPSLSGFGSTGADAVNDLFGNEDRARIVGRLRGFREEIRQMRAEMNRRAASGMSHDHRRPFAGRNLRSLFEPDVNHDERLQAAINHAIHGAFIANGGEPSVGTNIMDQTYRIQVWDFVNAEPPNLTDCESNIVVRRAKLHSDSSCDISQDGRVLCTFIQTSRSFSGDVTLGIFSLLPTNRGQCLYTKTFGPNAISVSLSPLNHYILVGLASKRFTWIFTPKQLVAQVYALKTEGAGENSMVHVHDVMHSCDLDFRAPVSMNSARWLLAPGDGLVYGTNRGDLHIRRPGNNQRDKVDSVDDELPGNASPVRHSLMQMLGLTLPRTISTATQTGAAGAQRSASTQTERASSPSGGETSHRRGIVHE